jgi:hypothetical protein
MGQSKGKEKQVDKDYGVVIVLVFPIHHQGKKTFFLRVPRLNRLKCLI